MKEFALRSELANPIGSADDGAFTPAGNVSAATLVVRNLTMSVLPALERFIL